MAPSVTPATSFMTKRLMPKGGVMEAMFAGGEAERFKNARYLSASIMLGDTGNEELPFEDAVNLDSGLGVVLLQAVNEVNNPVKN